MGFVINKLHSAT